MKYREIVFIKKIINAKKLSYDFSMVTELTNGELNNQ